MAISGIILNVFDYKINKLLPGSYVAKKRYFLVLFLMNRVVSRYLLTLLLISITTLSLNAQDLTGIWKGYFITDAGEYYRLEFQVNQNRSSVVSGVSYSYLDVRFYGKATMTGSFIRNSKVFRIREIKTVEIKSMGGDGACIMNYDLQYKKSGKEEFLEGRFLGKTEVKEGPNPYKWGQCGGGKVYLRRVTTSDFYIEPFLRGKIKRQDQDQVIVNKPPVRKDTSKTITKVNPGKKPVIGNEPPARKPITKVENPPISQKDSAVKDLTEPPVVKKNIDKIPTPPILKTRSNELVRVLTVKDPNVVIKIYDNGEIDDDTISVYLDNKLMLSKQKLTASPLTLKFNMGDDGDEHELVMVAENLGRIPPNTSLMIVESGGQRFEVRITSTEQKNAMIRFRYQAQ